MCIVSGFFVHAARLHYTGCYKLVCILYIIIVLYYVMCSGPLEVITLFIYILHQFFVKKNLHNGIFHFILYLLNIRPYFAVEYSPIFIFIIAHAQTIVRMRNDNYCLCYYGCDRFDAVF